MGAHELLAALKDDSVARLRHAMLKEAGVSPFSLRARFISDRQLLRYACHLALDRAAGEEKGEGSFDMERFLKMKEGVRERI